VGIDSKTRRLLLLISVAALMVAVLPAGAAANSAGAGIVSSVVKAPITPDGDVAGRPTDVVVNLDTSLDPAVPGRALLAGDTIKITLPSDFVNLGLPVANPGPPPAGCVAAAFNCSTGVLLQGWPQNPIPPTIAAGNYTVTLEGTNTIVYTATRDLVPGDPTLNGPGIKQMHVILNGFVNPNPGRYGIQVAAETGPGGTLETGTGYVHIRPQPRASINITSAFAARSNTIYQQTTMGSPTPIPWDFLVWDRLGSPAVGVAVEQVNATHAILTDGKRTVGQVFIDAPAGAQGQTVTGGPSTLLDAAPVLGLPTGRLTATFTAGDTPGTYVTTFMMNNGNSVQMHVEVAP
jgi:hypothetical protein